MPTKRSAMALASGALIGVGMISTPSDRKTSSKAHVYFESRSRIKNRNGKADHRPTRLRACWVTHAAFGFDVTPPRCTLREPISMKKSTYRRAEEDRVNGQEVAGDDARCLTAQEVTPTQARAARRRLDAVLFQDCPHGARSDGDPKAREFALNAAVAPRLVVLGQADNKPAGPRRVLVADRRAHTSTDGQRAFGARRGSSRGARGTKASGRAEGRGWLRRAGRGRASEGWPAHLPSQHVQLVAEYEDLDLLSSVGAQGKQDELKDASQSPVEERQDDEVVLLGSHEQSTL